MTVRESVSAFLLRHLKREHFLALRDAQLKLRNRAAPLLTLYHGKFDTDELIAHIDSRIPGDWEILMVHSSLNAMFPMYQGNAMELVKALVDYCGPERTLAMPAFWFGEEEHGGARPTLTQNPVYDVRRTPSQMGLATELFRRTPGVLQSLHPVYRVSALGPLAEELVSGHESIPTGMGAGSPFDVMAQRSTRILGIGKTFQVMTQTHHVESLLGDAYPVPAKEQEQIPVTLRQREGETTMMLGGRSLAWRFNIWKLREVMSPQELLEWQFHSVPLFSADAARVTDTLVEAAASGFSLYDPA